ncbi:hypothetical protein [Streptomyces cavernicola]|uniref:Uncharacterized protein n=1 Tax=Streptomyces cavernicola TaxID=3043613 RepID=A0ABT6SM64_9ACTN|nr:hypothetical protein [Streptomyces sp. B-S-A6]MDI3408311.1 hypothetical protein [Streptomyces sp. B-S-A6]
MPIPTDPRSPHQRVRDQLTMTRRQLTKPGLSRRQRADIADRIHDLEQQAKRLGA